MLTPKIVAKGCIVLRVFVKAWLIENRKSFIFLTSETELGMSTMANAHLAYQLRKLEKRCFMNSYN